MYFMDSSFVEGCRLRDERGIRERTQLLGALPQLCGQAVVAGLRRRLHRPALLEVLVAQARRLGIEREPHERARPALRRAEEGAGQREPDPGEEAVVLAEAGPDDARVEAVRGDRLVTALQLAREQDVA